MSIVKIHRNLLVYTVGAEVCFCTVGAEVCLYGLLLQKCACVFTVGAEGVQEGGTESALASGVSASQVRRREEQHVHAEPEHVFRQRESLSHLSRH